MELWAQGSVVFLEKVGGRKGILYLEHSEEKMLFTRLVLVSVEGEHDGLEKSIDLCKRDEATEGGDMAWLCLEEEEEVTV